MNHTITKFSLTLVALCALAACATDNRRLVEAKSSEAIAAMDTSLLKVRTSVVSNNAIREASQNVNRPYIAGNSIPLARETLMPEGLRKSVPVTAMFSNGAVPLTTALQQLSQASGMSVSATSDALLPASSFVPKTAVTNSPVQGPATVVLRASNTPLWNVLDDVARQAGLSWRPVATGAEFYRVETRVFELMAIPQIANTSASLGRSGGANLAFVSQSKSGFEMKDQNLLNGIQRSVEALMTTGGRLTLSQENQSLVVTDTPQALDQIASYVKDQNKAMGRRVRMLVEAIEVVAKDGNEFGLDWNLVYAAANRALTTVGAGSLVNPQAASLNLARSSGSAQGSALVIKALSEVGRVTNRSSFPFVTTSGRPITQALRTTFNYVDQVQATAIASSVLNTTAQAPTVSQKDETVGTFLTLIPTAKSDGSVFLSVAFDITSADPLRPFTVGSGASAVTVQQKTINGTGVIQEVPIRSGHTEVIGGIEVLQSQDTRRRLGEGVPLALGGSNSSNMTRSVLVLLVTAVTEEGI